MKQILPFIKSSKTTFLGILFMFLAVQINAQGPPPPYGGSGPGGGGQPTYCTEFPITGATNIAAGSYGNIIQVYVQVFHNNCAPNQDYSNYNPNIGFDIILLQNGTNVNLGHFSYSYSGNFASIQLPITVDVNAQIMILDDRFPEESLVHTVTGLEPFLITVDTTPPTVIVNPTVNVQLDANGNATITPQDVDNGSSDSDGAVTLSLDKTSFTCADLGENEITLTVTDESENSATASAIVTVIDAIAPNATASLDDYYKNGKKKKDYYVTNFSADDTCGTPSLVGIIELPDVSTFEVKYKTTKGKKEKESIKIDLKKNKVTIKAKDPHALYDQIVEMGGMSVENGDHFQFKSKKKKIEVTIKDGKIDKIEGSSLILSVTATDASGNATTVTDSVEGKSDKNDDNDDDDDDNARSSLSTYPNPAKGDFLVTLDNINNDVKIYIYDFYGRQVAFKKVKSKDGKITVKMGSHKLKNGNYLIKAYSNNKVYTKVMIIDHR